MELSVRVVTSLYTLSVAKLKDDHSKRRNGIRAFADMKDQRKEYTSSLLPNFLIPDWELFFAAEIVEVPRYMKG